MERSSSNSPLAGLEDVTPNILPVRRSLSAAAGRHEESSPVSTVSYESLEMLGVPSSMYGRRNRKQPDHDLFLDLTTVVANFSRDVEKFYRPTSLPLTRGGLAPGTPDKPGSRRLTFQPLPSMLLPRVRTRVRTDLDQHLKRGQAVPMDPITSLELSAASFGTWVSGIDSSDSNRSRPTPEQSEYLDHYSDGGSMRRWLDRLRKIQRRAARSIESELLSRVSCPDCRRLILEKGYRDQDVRTWWMAQRNNYQPLPKHNNVERGVVPHFCNFVHNKSLHDRDDDSLCTSHAPSNRRGVSPHNRDSSRVTNRSSTPGTEGRANSLADGEESDDNSTQILLDVPRIKISNTSDNPPVPPEKPPPKSQRPQTVPAQRQNSNPTSIYDHNRSKCSASKRTSSTKTGRKKKRQAATSNKSTDAKNNKIVTTTILRPEKESALPSVVSLKDKSTDVDLTGQSSNDPSTTAEGGDQSGTNVGGDSTRGRRQSIKKERKAFERERSVKEEVGLQEDEIKEEEEKEEPKEEAVQTESTPVVQAPPPPAIRVPELPKYQPRAREPSKPAHRISAQRSVINTGPVPAKAKVEDISDQEQKQYKFYSFNIMTDHTPTISQKPAVSGVSQGRLALSQQASRFELPMDMKLLETMTPVEYLSKYCIVTSKRQWLYEKIYLKNKDPKLGGLSLKGLEKALKEALVDTISPEEVQEMIKIAQISENTKIDQKLFVGIAAMTERMLYPRFLTEETQNIKDHKKEKIECADFCALEWKFHGVSVNPQIRRILEGL